MRNASLRRGAGVEVAWDWDYGNTGMARLGKAAWKRVVAIWFSRLPWNETCLSCLIHANCSWHTGVLALRGDELLVRFMQSSLALLVHRAEIPEERFTGSRSEAFMTFRPMRQCWLRHGEGDDGI